MKTPSTFSPTRRELVLLTGLLVLLLFLTQSEYITTLKPQNVGITREIQLHDGKHAFFSTGAYPSPRFTWSNTVPETDIVAHVPGELDILIS